MTKIFEAPLRKNPLMRYFPIINGGWVGSSSWLLCRMGCPPYRMVDEWVLPLDWLSFGIIIRLHNYIQRFLISVIKKMITIIRSKYDNIIDKGLASPISSIWFLVSPKKSNRDALWFFYMVLVNFLWHKKLKLLKIAQIWKRNRVYFDWESNR